jgi:hypothetical protein
MVSAGGGLSTQTRSVTPAATFARVRLRNFCLRQKTELPCLTTVCSRTTRHQRQLHILVYLKKTKQELLIIPKEALWA